MAVPPRIANAICGPVSLFHVLTNVLSNKIEVEILKLKLKFDNELNGEVEVATRSNFRDK